MILNIYDPSFCSITRNTWHQKTRTQLDSKTCFTGVEPEPVLHRQYERHVVVSQTINHTRDLYRGLTRFKLPGFAPRYRAKILQIIYTALVMWVVFGLKSHSHEKT